MKRWIFDFLTNYWIFLLCSALHTFFIWHHALCPLHPLHRLTRVTNYSGAEYYEPGSHDLLQFQTSLPRSNFPYFSRGPSTWHLQTSYRSLQSWLGYESTLWISYAAKWLEQVWMSRKARCRTSHVVIYVTVIIRGRNWLVPWASRSFDLRSNRKLTWSYSMYSRPTLDVSSFFWRFWVTSIFRHTPWFVFASFSRNSGCTSLMFVTDFNYFCGNLEADYVKKTTSVNYFFVMIHYCHLVSTNHVTVDNGRSSKPAIFIVLRISVHIDMFMIFTTRID